MIEYLALPFYACLVLSGIHCYLGMHIVMRGVIFVDLALAQIAAMGAVVGTLAAHNLGTEHGASEEASAYLFSLAFTFGGAALFAFARLREQRVPQEAIIGIVYAVASAVTLLILSQTAVDRDEVEAILVGRLLFVEAPQIVETLIIYAVVALIHLVFWRKFFAISRSAGAAMNSGMRVRAWDLLFYLTIGLVVTSAVQIAGVLLVFSFLVVPAVCAMLFFDSILVRLIVGWFLALVATVAGLIAAWYQDFPPGSSIVAAFGAIFVLFLVVYRARKLWA